MAAALLVCAVSCKHQDEETMMEETAEAAEQTGSSEGFTVTLDDAVSVEEAPAEADSTARKGLFAGIKGLFKSSRKEAADSTVTEEPVQEEIQAGIQEEVQEDEQPVEKQKARKERKERKEKKVKPVEVRPDTLASGSVWNSIDPADLVMNPVRNFSQDWMALVVGKNDKEHNSMTIAWGTIGQLWNKPVVIVYVSEDRYTKHLLDACDMFSVVGFPDKKKYRDALLYIGSHSQKDEPDKTENAGLTVEHTKNGTPIIAEGDLAIECRKIYEDAFDIDKVPSDVRNGMYQEMGIHHMYIGEIVSVLQKN